MWLRCRHAGVFAGALAATFGALERVLIGLGDDVDGTGDAGISDGDGSADTDVEVDGASVPGAAPADPPPVQPPTARVARITSTPPRRVVRCLENAMLSFLASAEPLHRRSRRSQYETGSLACSRPADNSPPSVTGIWVHLMSLQRHQMHPNPNGPRRCLPTGGGVCIE
jgi:hypothetical protein